MQVAKYCCLPICNGEKFNLVHKFPSDVAKYQEWISIIENSSEDKQLPEKMKQKTPEQIKTRFFICSRHFGISAYKNAESRSLNLTAIPHLNLNNLNDLKLSKAYQLETMSKVQSKIETSKPTILNQNYQQHSPKIEGKAPLLTVVVNKAAVAVKNTAKRPSSLSPSKNNKVATPKRMKIDQNPHYDELPSLIEEIQPVSNPSPVKIEKQLLQNLPKKITNKVLEKPTVDLNVSIGDNTIMSQNKLLALIEVTPDQYEKLNQKLSAAERSTKVENLISSFLDNDTSDEHENENELEIKIDDEKSIHVDLMWLRDHCRCEKCYDSSTYQRKVNILDLADDVSVKTFDINNGKLNVIWNDEHKSTYDIEFLTKNQYGESSSKSSKILWNIDNQLKANCRCSMRDYMSDPEVSKDVLKNLHQYGVAFIENVQPTQQNTEFVIRQLFPIHRTLFGEMWTFSDEKKDHADTAYTSDYLGPHNDNTYFNDASGLQILHCILRSQDCTGGENFLIDGFQVAEKIKENEPEIFKRLTTTLVPAEYIEENRHHKYMAPIIKLHPITNEIEQVRFNIYDRAPMNSLPREKIRQFYSDLKFLAREMEKPENRITFKLEPGTVMIFDNWRVLHGRNAYNGKRTMTGCYVQRTEYLSALRVNGFIE